MNAETKATALMAIDWMLEDGREVRIQHGSVRHDEIMNELRVARAAIEAGGAWEPVTELKLRDGHVLRMSSEAMAISYDHEALTDIYWPDDGYEYAVVRRRTTLRKRPDSEATP